MDSLTINSQLQNALNRPYEQKSKEIIKANSVGFKDDLTKKFFSYIIDNISFIEMILTKIWYNLQISYYLLLKNRIEELNTVNFQSYNNNNIDGRNIWNVLRFNIKGGTAIYLALKHISRLYKQDMGGYLDATYETSNGRKKILQFSDWDCGIHINPNLSMIDFILLKFMAVKSIFKTLNSHRTELDEFFIKHGGIQLFLNSIAKHSSNRYLSHIPMILRVQRHILNKFSPINATTVTNNYDLELIKQIELLKLFNNQYDDNHYCFVQYNKIVFDIDEWIEYERNNPNSNIIPIDRSFPSLPFKSFDLLRIMTNHAIYGANGTNLPAGCEFFDFGIDNYPLNERQRGIADEEFKTLNTEHMFNFQNMFAASSNVKKYSYPLPGLYFSIKDIFTVLHEKSLKQGPPDPKSKKRCERLYMIKNVQCLIKNIRDLNVQSFGNVCTSIGANSVSIQNNRLCNGDDIHEYKLTTACGNRLINRFISNIIPINDRENFRNKLNVSLERLSRTIKDVFVWLSFTDLFKFYVNSQPSYQLYVRNDAIDISTYLNNMYNVQTNIINQLTTEDVPSYLYGSKRKENLLSRPTRPIYKLARAPDFDIKCDVNRAQIQIQKTKIINNLIRYVNVLETSFSNTERKIRNINSVNDIKDMEERQHARLFNHIHNKMVKIEQLDIDRYKNIRYNISSGANIIYRGKYFIILEEGEDKIFVKYFIRKNVDILNMISSYIFIDIKLDHEEIPDDIKNDAYVIRDIIQLYTECRINERTGIKCVFDNYRYELLHNLNNAVSIISNIRGMVEENKRTLMTVINRYKDYLNINGNTIRNICRSDYQKHVKWIVKTMGDAKNNVRIQKYEKYYLLETSQNVFFSVDLDYLPFTNGIIKTYNKGGSKIFLPANASDIFRDIPY
ncbi:hypothetical protein OAF54_03130 [bacterium]|nr:hypothetical protein [bacterium]